MNIRFPIFGALLAAITTACGGLPTPNYVLEASAGTYVQQVGAGSSDTTLGTSFVVKLRTREGKLVSSPASVTIQGPSGWNAGKVSSFTAPANAYWVIAPEIAAAPVEGEYRVTALVGGETLEKKISIGKTPNQLGLTTITAKVVGDAPNQTVEASWEAVPGATGYYARVQNGTDGVPASDDAYSLEPKASLMVGTFNPSKAYFVVVFATTMDTVANEPKLPEAFHVSDSIAALTLQAAVAQSAVTTNPLVKRNGFTSR